MLWNVERHIYNVMLWNVCTSKGSI